MAVFALVELELHGLPQVAIGEIAHDVLRFDDPAEVGKRLGQPVRRKAVGQALHNHMRWGRALLEGERHAEHFVPLLLHNAEVGGLGEQGRKYAVVDQAVKAVPLLVFEVPDARHKIEAQQVTQGKDDLSVAVGIRRMLANLQNRIELVAGFANWPKLLYFWGKPIQ